MSHHDLNDADASAEDHLLTAADGDAGETEGDSHEVPQNGHDLDDADLDGGEDDAE